MTLREAAEQALEALEEYQRTGAPFMSCDAAVDALRAALEQATVKESLPVGRAAGAARIVMRNKRCGQH